MHEQYIPDIVRKRTRLRPLLRSCRPLLVCISASCKGDLDFKRLKLYVSSREEI